MRSIESFSKVVEAIYDCALDPDGWHETLRLIGDLTDSPNMCVGITNYAQKRVVSGIYSGYDPAYMKVYSEKFSVNLLWSAGHRRPVGEVYTGTTLIEDEMLIDRKEFRESQYYHEWVKPQEFGDIVGLNAVRANRRVGGLYGNRMTSQAPYDERDTEFFRLLAPHICRTFAISEALNLRTATSRTLEAMLDALTISVYLVDRESRVVYMNDAAEQQSRCSNALRIVNKRVFPASIKVRALMTKAIAEAIADEGALPTGGTTLALPSRDGGGLVATILPLNRGRRRILSEHLAATAAIFVQDPVTVPLYPGEAFAQIHGLTGGELRVLLALMPGLSVKDAADMLGVSESTAKTHLQRIFCKTNTSKQTELLHLLLSSTPPIRAGRAKPVRRRR